VISAGTRIFSLTAGTVAMSIGGLIAFSNYSVYCYTVDLSERFPWPLPYVLSTGVHFSTKCCRLITLTTFPAVIYDNSSQATPPVFTFALESVPPKALIVSVQLKKSALSAVTAGTCGTSDSSASAVAIPNRFGFSTASLSLLGNFIVSGNPGCYDVSVVSTLYDYSASTQTLLVQKSTAALSAPYMTSCTFTSDGLRLTVGFSTNTDRGAKTISSYLLTFPCSQLLNFTGVAASVCYWQSASILVVSNVPSVAVGSNVTILSGRIKAYGECSACNNFPFSARRTLVAAAPADGVIPRPALSAPQKVSSCDDLYIDTTSSTGNAGRSWKRVQWGISTYPSHNSTDVLLETYLNALRGETGDVFVIPNSLIVAYDRIIFYLGLTNFLGITGWTSTSVTLVFSSEIVPRLSLIGAKHLTQYVSQPVQYFAFVQFPPCAKVDPTKIAYIWEFYSSNNTKLTAPKFYKQLNDIRYFKLDSFVLSPSTSYTLQVLIQLPSYTGSRNLSSAEAYIATLPPQGVRAIISGGNARTADVSQAVSIDGSASYDLDVGQPSGSKLFYSWTCLQILPMYGSVCPFQVPTNTNSSNFTLAAHSFVLSASTTCLITLFVKNRNSASDSAEVYIAFSTSSVPQVGFSSSALKYNPTDKITLKAILGASSVDVVVTWGCDRLDNSALQQISNAGISTQFGPTSSSIVMYLPILPGSLFAGGKYVFSVTAQYLLSSTSSTASLQVEINSPPTSGSFLVSPTLGIALNTTFSMRASAWTDDPTDYPLLYSMAAYSVSVDNKFIVKTSGVDSFSESVLGEGREEYGYNVTCILFVSDNLNSTASTTKVVVVTPPTNFTEVKLRTRSAMSLALLAGDASGVNTVISSAGAFLNSVKCPSLTFCASLNRNPCEYVANTCGSCLDGFVGVNGASNTACIDKPHSQVVSFASRSGGQCHQNSDCLSNSCLHSHCVDILKSCPNDCSGNGTCVFYNNENVTIPACYSSDIYCQSRCSCRDGSLGADCSMDVQTFNDFSELREQLCLGLTQATAYQDVNIDVVASRAISVATLLQDVTQMTDAAIGNCTHVLLTTVQQYPQIAGYSTVSPLCASALSQVLGSNNSVVVNQIQAVKSTIGILSSGIQMSLSPDENPVQVLTSNVRMTSGVVRSISLSTSAFSLPTTDSENYDSVETPSLELSSSNNGALITDFSVAIRQFPTLSANYSSQSAAVGIHISGGDTDTVLDSTITLVNRNSIDYNNSNDGNKTVACDWALRPYNVSYNCSNGQEVLFHCSGYASTHFFECPSNYVEPVCEKVQSNGPTTTSTCSVLSFTATTTTCSCSTTVANDAGINSTTTTADVQKRMSTFAEYATMASMFTSEFSDNFRLITHLNLHDVARNRVVLAACSTLVFLGLAGLAWFINVDTREVLHEEATINKEGRLFLPAKEYLNLMLPREFSNREWYKIFFECLKVDHDWLCLFLPISDGKKFHSISWLLIIGKITNFLFLDTILAVFFFADDGTCETFTNEDTCLQLLALDRLDTLCMWDQLHRDCSFNQDIGNSPVQMLLLTTVISILSIPLDMAFLGLINRIKIHFVDYYATKAKAGVAASLNKDIHTDFGKDQPTISRIYIFAAAEVMKAKIDEVAPAEEVERLVSQTRLSHQESAHKLSAVFEAKQLESYVLDKRFEMGERKVNVDEIMSAKLQKRIIFCRDEAKEISDRLNTLETDHEKNSYLLKKFILSSVSGSVRKLATKYFFPDIDDVKDRSNVGVWDSRICIFLLVAYMALANFYVFVFGVSIGPKATYIWLKGNAISLAIEIFALVPFKTLVNKVLVAQYCCRDIHLCHGLLRERSSFLFKRRRGLIKNPQAIIHHLNPACRAARQHRTLAASRLLLALNDHDLPVQFLQEGPSTVWDYLLTYLTPLVGLFIIALEFLPGIVTDAAFQTATTSALNVALLAICVLAISGSVFLAVLGAVIVVAAAYGERRMARRRLKHKGKASRPVHHKPFEHVTVDAIEVHSPDKVNVADYKKQYLEGRVADSRNDRFSTKHVATVKPEYHNMSSLFGSSKNIAKVVPTLEMWAPAEPAKPEHPQTADVIPLITRVPEISRSTRYFGEMEAHHETTSHQQLDLSYSPHLIANAMESEIEPEVVLTPRMPPTRPVETPRDVNSLDEELGVRSAPSRQSASAVSEDEKDGMYQKLDHLLVSSISHGSVSMKLFGDFVDDELAAASNHNHDHNYTGYGAHENKSSAFVQPTASTDNGISFGKMSRTGSYIDNNDDDYDDYDYEDDVEVARRSQASSIYTVPPQHPRHAF
jgi:hypothetical protein